ncbi:MAG: DNA polymerase III subunit delta [Flavobacteriales bacterium]|nr:DNA polymerase III subunit delta [Flavobacteriales bacterium]MCX7767401.1 DNA polymerase III subunit delta [Flavobacteriales bacterium]MDW8410183.1 DNA polymerase III subunit delta [Flavobacteriales bacterium]
MVRFEEIMAELRSGQLAPIYILAGEEPWYIDRLSDAFENSVVEEDHKAFDFSKHFGKGLVKQSLLADLRSFPLMGSRRLVILREAQDAEKEKDSSDFLEYLTSYFQQPTRSTVFVMCYKAKPDKRRTVWKTLMQLPYVRFFLSDKPREQQLPAVINSLAIEAGIHLHPDAVLALMELVGTDMARLDNEIRKLALATGPGAQIDRETVLDKVSFSRQYNIFELYRALAHKNKSQILQIGLNMARNSRENPLIRNINQLFSFFSNLLLFMYYIKREKLSPDQAAQTMNLNFYSRQDYIAALNRYSFEQVQHILALLMEYDLKAKGVGARADEEVLMTELTIHLAK